jgi:hypothetical protein
MRDDRTQAAGPFPRAKGSLLRHEKLVEFIQRNYECDEGGQWFFQNGPQRVYVELEATPFVFRVSADGSVAAHTGREASVKRAIIDEDGRAYLDTDIGFGVIHTLDMEAAADAIEQGRWATAEIDAAELPAHFHFVRSPAQQKAGTKPA